MFCFSLVLFSLLYIPRQAGLVCTRRGVAMDKFVLGDKDMLSGSRGIGTQPKLGVLGWRIARSCCFLGALQVFSGLPNEDGGCRWDMFERGWSECLTDSLNDLESVHAKHVWAFCSLGQWRAITFLEFFFFFSICIKQLMQDFKFWENFIFVWEQFISLIQWILKRLYKLEKLSRPKRVWNKIKM